MKKHGKKLFLFLSVWSILLVCCAVFPADEKSYSERRILKQFPKVTAQSLLSGGFMQGFEAYALDQFPFRDLFRALNTITTLYGFGQKDNEGLYLADGHIGKLDMIVNQNSLSNAIEKFRYLQERYLQENKVYLSIIPDKGYFLAEKNGYPSMDYEQLVRTMVEGMPYAEYVDIMKTLSLSSYYKTDTHWRQEKLLETAKQLKVQMGISKRKSYSYEQKMATEKFYGVYYGQLALPFKPEPLYYLTNDGLEKCYTISAQTQKKGKVYDFHKLDGNDPYELFLSGSVPIITLVNPENASGKKLILFRDSYGSSIAPLLAEDYAEITLIDIRYVSSQILGELVEFKGKEVLFLYSTLLLNSSYTLK